MDEALTGQAGEFVLGTLDAAERAAFLRDLARDGDAVRAVAEWQARLAPLATSVPDVAPPDHVWAGIAARLDAQDAPVAANDNRVAAWWRAGAVAASLAALLLAGVAFNPSRRAPVASEPIVAQAPVAGASYVSALSREGAEPALLVTLDAKTGKAVIRAIGLTPPDRKSLELWYIGGGRDPQSLGLVSGDRRIETVLAEALAQRDRLDQSQFAISVEPEGGAPAGKPTGAIVYSGKVLAISGT